MSNTGTHSEAPNDSATAEELRARFRQIAETATDANDREVGMTAALVTDLLTSVLMLDEEAADPEPSAEILQFCREQIYQLLTEEPGDEIMIGLRDHIEEQWGHCLSLLEPAERCPGPGIGHWNDGAVDWDVTEASETDEAGIESIPANLGELLSSLSSVPSRSTTEPHDAINSAPKHPARVSAELHPDLPPAPETIDDPELAAAFSDDAQQCLAEMETSLLNLESANDTDEPRRHFCRQLHTLKGASGTVGLSQLASYLHDLESYVEDCGALVNVDRLLTGVDAVRAQLSALTQRVPQASAESQVNAFSTAATTTGESELFVRVEASRLERLMDLLAELVMLRSRRDNDVESLRTVHSELNNCATRLRMLTIPTDPLSHRGKPRHTGALAQRRSGVTEKILTESLEELSKDTAELARSLHSVFDPLAADNSAVSHLIGRFRQELMELRRLPVSGLFQRLQRSIRDAANAEQKNVEIVLNGQGARAERAIQDRLFEPLLHIVRNAVSHGIQQPQQRTTAGKPTTGKITLSAWSDASTLSIEVRDDGNGLNHEALEARGRQLGLLPAGENVDEQQLWKLIFRAGFSTKTNVSEISGRGVGMDVVDRQIRRLRGRISVDSKTGEGTTFLLQIPLRSAVEHAMIVRCHDQLFALPLHAVSNTSVSGLSLPGTATPSAEIRATPLSDVLGLENHPDAPRSFLTLRRHTVPGQTNGAQPAQSVTVSVDAIVGVEEVVVRSLPKLLQQHEFLAGVTLSGRAETVLLLDAGRVVERIVAAAANMIPADQVSPAEERSGDDVTRCTSDAASDGRRCILVVDDSVAIRRVLEKKLRSQGFAIRTANNGRQALDVLRTGGVCGVVTDIDMPVMNGAELLQEIRRSEVLRSLPVAVLSSRSADILPPEFLDALPQVTLAKPVTDESIKTITETFARALSVNSLN